MIRYLLAPMRCLVQVVLAAYGLVLALLAIVGATVVVAFPAAATAILAASGLGRRLAGRWGGIEIGSVPRSPAPVVERRADGWFAYNNQLFRSRAVPQFMLKLEHLSKDATLMRDWMWLFTTPFT